jgi:hypothetical protein
VGEAESGSDVPDRSAFILQCPDFGSIENHALPTKFLALGTCSFQAGSDSLYDALPFEAGRECEDCPKQIGKIARGVQKTFAVGAKLDSVGVKQFQVIDCLSNTLTREPVQRLNQQDIELATRGRFKHGPELWATFFIFGAGLVIFEFGDDIPLHRFRELLGSSQTADLVGSEAFAGGRLSFLAIQDSGDDIVRIKSSQATQQGDRIFISTRPHRLESRDRNIKRRDRAATPAQSHVRMPFSSSEIQDDFFQQGAQ